MNMRRTLELQADRLEAALAQHSITGQVTGATVTSRWVRFQVWLDPGVGVGRVRGLPEGLAKTLAVNSVEITALAVEVPPNER
jgi:DNA segregation ATPase FtsK/SpoIIIE-like protein